MRATPRANAQTCHSRVGSGSADSAHRRTAKTVIAARLSHFSAISSAVPEVTIVQHDADASACASRSTSHTSGLSMYAASCSGVASVQERELRFTLYGCWNALRFAR